MNIERVGAELGQAIHKIAVSKSQKYGFTWEACEDPFCPTTLDSLKREFSECHRTGVPFRVSSANSENTIYGNPAFNHAFRFWHDVLHVERRKDTSLQHELRVGQIHVEVIKQLGYSQDHQTLMWIDTCGQGLYNFLVTEFPRDQMGFAKRVLALRTLAHASTMEHAVRIVAHQDVEKQ
jgi:hypothetical protein